MKNSLIISPRRGARFAAAAVLICAAALLSQGCGKSVTYSFPLGKSIVYNIYEQKGKIENGAEQWNNEIFTMVLKLRARQRILKRTSVLATVYPAKYFTGQSIVEKLGELDLRIDRRGRVAESYGMGVPIDLRLVVPELPGRLSKNKTWTETVTHSPIRKKIDVTLTTRYAGTELVMNRRCVHLRGEGRYEHAEDYDNPDRGQSMHMELRYEYVEDRYIDAGRGYLLKTVTLATRDRNIINNNTGDTLHVIDLKRLRIEMAGTE